MPFDGTGVGGTETGAASSFLSRLSSVPLGAAFKAFKWTMKKLPWIDAVVTAGSDLLNGKSAEKAALDGTVAGVNTAVDMAASGAAEAGLGVQSTAAGAEGGAMIGAIAGCGVGDAVTVPVGILIGGALGAIAPGTVAFIGTGFGLGKVEKFIGGLFGGGEHPPTAQTPPVVPPTLAASDSPLILPSIEEIVAARTALMGHGATAAQVVTGPIAAPAPVPHTTGTPQRSA